MLRQIKFYCVIFLLTSNVIDAQVTVSLEKGQALLSQLFTDAAVKKTDIEKEKVHDSIAIVLHAALQDTGSFDFPFQDVKNLGKVYSDDKKIRFYTWNLPYADGTSRYYGFVQYKPGKGAPVYVYRLTDESNTINDATSAVTHPENWYGCLVYEITSYRQDKQYYYILLGYDPHNLFISRRVIDIMYFDESGNPVFGKPIFEHDNKLQTRVLFEYSARAQMNLHWIQGMKMIVFDHLSPESSSYAGKYQFYGPDFSYDGFSLDEGIWKLQENIDIRNMPE